MTSNGPEQPTLPTQEPPVPGAPPVERVQPADRGGSRWLDLGLAAAALVYLVAAVLPWYGVDAFDLGSGYAFPRVRADGLDSGFVVLAAVLLLLAAAWAVLTVVPVRFPRSFVTVGLTAVAFLLTAVEELSDVDLGFSPAAFLALLAAGAALVLAVRRAWPDLTGEAAPDVPAEPSKPAVPVSEIPAETPSGADTGPAPDEPYRGPPAWVRPADLGTPTGEEEQRGAS